MAARGISLVVTANFAAADRFVLTVNRTGQPPFTALTSIDDKRKAGSGESHDLVRTQNGLNQQTLDILQANVFIGVAREQNAVELAAHHPLGFGREDEAIDRGLARRPAELIDGISILVETLHDAIGPRVNG